MLAHPQECAIPQMCSRSTGVLVVWVALALTTVVEGVPTPSQSDVQHKDTLEASKMHRQLQATGTPDKCTDPASYATWLAVVNQACCGKAGAQCTDGLPTACDEEVSPTHRAYTAQARECTSYEAGALFRRVLASS